MYIGETYQVIRYLLADTKDEALKKLNEKMSPTEPDGVSSADKAIFPLFLKAVETLEDEVASDSSGFEYAQKFAELCTQNQIIGGPELELYLTRLGQKEFDKQAALVLSQDAYAYLYWLICQLEKTQAPCHQLTILKEGLKPTVLEDGKEKMNGYLVAFANQTIAKPDFGFDGFANATSFLLGTGNETAQTVLLRLGSILWESLFPLFSFYNPHDGSSKTVEIDSDFEKAEFRGKDLARYIPLLLFLGYRLDFEINEKKFSLVFPFHPIDTTDVTLTLPDGSTFSKSYLDDIDKEWECISSTPLKLISEADKVTVKKL